MLYLINNNIVFNTEDRTLVMQQDEMSAVILSNSANRLLYELLYSYGQTVSRDSLFQNVWDNHGLVSSNSNLNHYISQLRKSLVSFGLSDKVIITIPKVGFKFSEKVPVMLMDDNGDTPRAEDKNERLESVYQELDNLTTEILSQTQDRTELTDINLQSLLSQNIAQSDDVNKKITTKPSYKMLYVVCSILALVSLTFIALFFTMDTRSVKNNFFTAESDICPIYKFYPLPDELNGKATEDIDSIIKNNNISCKNDQFIMVNYGSKTFASLCSVTEQRSFSCKALNS